MHRVLRIAIALSCGSVLLTMSACFTAPSRDSGYSSERGATPGYSPASVSSPVSSASSAVDLGPSDTIPAGYRDDRAQSIALTNYLDKNRLPMVGAQVFANSRGDRQVILHGFVATDSGRQNAAAKARRYLGDPEIPVINRILVRPELRTSSDSDTSSLPPVTPPGGSYNDSGLGSAESYQSQAQQLQSQRDLSTLLELFRLMVLFF